MKKNLQEETIKALLENNGDNEVVWEYSLDEIKSMSVDDLDEAGELALLSKPIDDDRELVISLFYGTGGFVLYANIFEPNGEISDHPINSLDIELTTEDNLKQDMVRLLNETEAKCIKKVDEAVTPDKEYQGIKYFDNQDGWCPVCNAHLHYEPIENGGTNEDGDSVAYCGWTCDKCGTKGEAYFKQSFIGHSVYDDNFDLIDLPFGETKTESKQDDEIKSLRDEIWTYITDDVHHLEDFADYEISSEEDNDEAHEIARANLDKFSLGELREMANEIASGSIDLVNWGHKVLESKKVEATDRNIDKSKVLNMKYADLPEMCYGLLPSDNSVIIIKKGETGYYETDYGTPENPEEFVTSMNEKLGVTPEQRMVMELRSMSGNWVLPNEGDKKEEAVEEQSAPDYLRKAFEVEVEYWLKALVDENSNDDIGKKSQEVLDDKNKMQEIVNELVDGSDDLWEDIHRRIEELAGVHYRESSRVDESADVKSEAYNYYWKDDVEEVENTEANDELAYAFAENLIETDPDYANYDDPWDVLSQIIYIWKIAKRSRLYDFLLKWYGSEEEMKKHIRSFYETSDAIYFETGAGYSFFSADLLGGTEDGNAAREFDDFVKNGGKRVK